MLELRLLKLAKRVAKAARNSLTVNESAREEDSLELQRKYVSLEEAESADEVAAEEGVVRAETAEQTSAARRVRVP